jgi:hypothetical protein
MIIILYYLIKINYFNHIKCDLFIYLLIIIQWHSIIYPRYIIANVIKEDADKIKTEVINDNISCKDNQSASSSCSTSA